MKESKKQYWKGLEELTNDPGFVKNANKEFPEYLPINEGRMNESEDGSGPSRRDFLKMMGFGVAAASLAACEAPVRKAIPYLNKPVEVDPGVANYYASTYAEGGDYCSIVIKTREGRPIKIEGNSLSKITKGGTNAQVEASVLSLYDQERLRTPYAEGSASDWSTVDGAVTSKLNAIASKGGQIRIVTNTILSPTTKKVLADFSNKFPTAKVITYDSQSADGLLQANKDSFGSAMVPSYDFSKADVIVGLDADFLGTWISPIEYTKQYSQTRKLSKNKKKMSKHFQFESNLSLTGANADYRIKVKPSQQGLVVANLYNAIAAKTGGSRVSVDKLEVAELDKAANALLASKGKSLVVSGSNDKDIQLMVNAINNLLGNYGTTIDTDNPVNYRQGDDAAMGSFVKEASSVDAVIFYNANPVYDHPSGAELAEKLGSVGLVVSTSDRMDETASVAHYVAPDSHYLESWNDAEPKNGTLSLCQPGISPLFKTRQAQESFLTWSGQPQEYYAYLQDTWKSDYAGDKNFEMFWDKCLYDGVVELTNKPVVAADTPELLEGEEEASDEVQGFAANISGVAQRIKSKYKVDNTGFELAIYNKVGIGSGKQANNPWLQEMPDPITKATWDNYVTISQSDASNLGIRMEDENTVLVNLTVDGASVKAPALVQPGQAPGTVGLALGYGRTKAGLVGNNLGVNAYPFVGHSGEVSVASANESYKIARTQTHQTYMDRETVIQESILSKYQKNPKAGRYEPKIATWTSPTGKMDPKDISLWHGYEYPNHHWGLAIDLNSCTGCSACVVSCHAENNVPVVGKQEVINRRDMHWMRIDRYYSSDGKAGDNKALEIAAENPEVVFQPMMCQHCNNAPCETVCPVAATTHSTEGLNQMAYNRCIGTRYCANNCPYKVRRFNWFKYHDNNDQFNENTSMNNSLGKMVLNPDVTVRARGVMEKCTLCVQRIQLGKLDAKKEKRKVKDGEINTACASACPADAIVFGDMNDPKSQISMVLKDENESRAYHVLEEIHVSPNVSYLTKIRNKDEQKA